MKKMRVFVIVLGLIALLFAPVMAVSAQETRDAIVITDFDPVRTTELEYPVEVEVRFGQCEAPELWLEIDYFVEEFQLTENNLGNSNTLTYAPALVVDEDLGVYSATFFMEFLPTNNYIAGNTYAATAAIGIGCYGQEPTWLGYHLVGQYIHPFQSFLPLVIN